MKKKVQYRLYFIKCNTYIHPKKTRIFIDNLIYYNTWEIHCIFHMNIGILRTHVYCVWRDVYIVMYVIKVYAFFLNKKKLYDWIFSCFNKGKSVCMSFFNGNNFSSVQIVAAVASQMIAFKKQQVCSREIFVLLKK